jgi:hypothetical protein
LEGLASRGDERVAGRLGIDGSIEDLGKVGSKEVTVRGITTLLVLVVREAGKAKL